ncbi:conserved hypothetical protein [Candidatus Terasakiella magnetica]|nr:conserved hypothetical protein [Candidatus Terasakiella magnetica]
MFVLSKLWRVLSDPVTLFFLVVSVGCILGWSRRHTRLGRGLITWAVGGVVVLSQIPVEQWLEVPLENRFPPPQTLPEKVDGIIVLGGAIDPVLSHARGQVVANSAITRLTALIPLAKHYPEARLVFTGGSGSIFDQEIKEAPYAIEFYRSIGFYADRVQVEDRSRNTHENAVFTRELMAPQAGETWLLITSAFHMPRAVGSFRAVNWPVIAFPVDYQTTERPWTPRLSIGGPLNHFTHVMNEAVGLAYYRLRGWSDAFYPAP